jgi:hypothetical protein
MTVTDVRKHNMRIRAKVSRMFVAILIAGGVMGQQWLAADNSTPAKKRAMPPKKWDNRTVDTFFSDAKTVLDGDRPTFGDATSIASGKTPAGDTGSSGGGAPAGGGDAPAATGEFAWSKLIAPESLMDEIKSYQGPVKDDTSNPSKFKGEGFKDARKSFSVLALLFGVINEYDGDVRWKNQAIAARDGFARAAANCKVATDGSFNESKQRAEDLAALVRGESLPAPAAADKPQWAKVAARPPLMNRLELAQQGRIAVWTANQGDFGKNQDALVREAQLVAVIAEVIQREGYEFTDDNSYKGFARDMQKHALAVADGAKSKNFEQTRLAAGELAKVCSNCHSSFRN